MNEQAKSFQVQEKPVREEIKVEAPKADAPKADAPKAPAPDPVKAQPKAESPEVKKSSVSVEVLLDSDQASETEATPIPRGMKEVAEVGTKIATYEEKHPGPDTATGSPPPTDEEKSHRFYALDESLNVNRRGRDGNVAGYVAGDAVEWV